MRQFLDGMTVACEQPFYKAVSESHNIDMYTGARGSPENMGDVLEAVHPLVRTNPVTGWKALYGIGHHIESLHKLSDEESNYLLEYFLMILNENHDLQLRLHYGLNDVVIWDNRSVLNAPISDFIFNSAGDRKALRTIGIGERPYHDPQSTSRREAIEQEGVAAPAKVTNPKKTFVGADYQKANVIPKAVQIV